MVQISESEDCQTRQANLLTA